MVLSPFLQKTINPVIIALITMPMEVMHFQGTLLTKSDLWQEFFSTGALHGDTGVVKYFASLFTIETDYFSLRIFF